VGLYQNNFRFERTLPNLEEVRVEARRRLGWYWARAIEGLETDGQLVIARSLLNPFTHPVLCAILQEMGGQSVSNFDGKPQKMDVPAWAHAPISQMPFGERMATRYRWWAWLLGTARPRS
jgi:hypothetical protein